MRKGLALTTVFMAIVIAVVIVASTFAFFSNVPDKTVVTIGANDDFSISLGDAVGTAQLFPQTPVSDNSGGVSGEKYASVTIEYTVAVEGAESITLRVSDSYAWTGVDADVEDLQDLQDYVNSHIKCRLYAAGEQPPEWGAAEYKLPKINPGATGTVKLDVMLDLSEELAPPELKGATLTVRVGVEKTTSGESA